MFSFRLPQATVTVYKYCHNLILTTPEEIDIPKRWVHKIVSEFVFSMWEKTTIESK
jgi:hypothetical protein